MANLPFISAGTITLTNASDAVSGSGTTFNQLLPNASILYIYDEPNDKTHVIGVSAITDDANLTAHTAWPHPTLNNAPYFAQVLSNTVAGMQEVAAKVLSFLAANATGRTILNGTGAPDDVADGINGDFYIDTVGFTMYGPKAADVWPTPGVELVGTNGTNGTNGVNGQTLLTGTSAPNNGSDGTNGDFYINTTTWEIHGPKAGGAWPAGVALATGPTGADGRTILNGVLPPDDVADGVNDDFFIDTNTWFIYGPKAGGAWPTGVDLVGATLRSGAGIPSGALGDDDDFYINTTLWTIYGPKTGGVWGSPTTLATGPIGPTGPGVPNGGAAGEILSKVSSTDQDTAWIDAAPSVKYVTKTDVVTINDPLVWTVIPGMSLSLTLAAGQSALLTAMLTLTAATTNYITGIRVLRDSTVILQGDAAGVRERALTGFNSADFYTTPPSNVEVIDENPGAGTYTYTIEVRQQTGNIYLNRSTQDSDLNTYYRYASTFKAQIVNVIP